MHEGGPDAFVARVRPTDEVRHLAASFLEQLRSTSWFGAESIVVDGGRRAAFSGKLPPRPVGAVVLTTPAHSALHVFRAAQTTTVELRLTVVEEDYRRLTSGPAAELARIALAAVSLDHISDFEVYREGTRVDALPNPPLASWRTQVRTVGEAEVAAAHADGAAFWGAWERAGSCATGIVLTRELDRWSDLEYHEAIEDHQRLLARAARPGLTKYSGAFRLPADVQSALRARHPTLSVVGYDPDARRFDVACAPPDGGHALSHEIFELRRILEYGRLLDGRAIASVRVIFPDEGAARSEMRPMLDLGAEVWFLRSDGELAQLLDATVSRG